MDISADSLLPKFADAIRILPAGPLALDAMAERFTLHAEGRLRIVYAPFDSMNLAARVVIVGITPGLHQAQVAFEAVRSSLAHGDSLEVAGVDAKFAASFSGPMRANLCKMLDALGLNKLLGISSATALFGEARNLLHSTSAIRHPVFIDDQNYAGQNPEMCNHPLLLPYIENVLAKELDAVSGALVVPLGKAVERVIKYLIWGGRLDERRCLLGLPHPSGGNAHRVRQFEERRKSLTESLQEWHCDVDERAVLEQRARVKLTED